MESTLTREDRKQQKRERKLQRWNAQCLASLTTIPHATIQDFKCSGDITNPLLLATVLSYMPQNTKGVVMPQLSVSPQHRYCFLRQQPKTTAKKEEGERGRARNAQHTAAAEVHPLFSSQTMTPLNTLKKVALPHIREVYDLDTHKVIPTSTLWLRETIRRRKMRERIGYAWRRSRQYGIDLAIAFSCPIRRPEPVGFGAARTKRRIPEIGAVDQNPCVEIARIFYPYQRIVQQKRNDDGDGSDTTLTIQLRDLQKIVAKLRPDEDGRPLSFHDRLHEVYLPELITTIRHFALHPKHHVQHLRFLIPASENFYFSDRLFPKFDSEALRIPLLSFGILREENDEVALCENGRREDSSEGCAPTSNAGETKKNNKGNGTSFSGDFGAYQYILDTLDLGGLYNLQRLGNNCFSYLRKTKTITLTPPNKKNTCYSENQSAPADWSCNELSLIESEVFSHCRSLQVLDLSSCSQLEFIQAGFCRGCCVLHTVKLPPTLKFLKVIGSCFLSGGGSDWSWREDHRRGHQPSVQGEVDDGTLSQLNGRYLLDFGDCPCLEVIGSDFLHNNRSFREVRFGTLPSLKYLFTSPSLAAIGSFQPSVLGNTHVEELELGAFGGPLQSGGSTGDDNHPVLDGKALRCAYALKTVRVAHCSSTRVANLHSAPSQMEIVALE